MLTPDPLADAALIAVEEPPPVTLADKFLIPPMSVLDRRGGPWKRRRAQWSRVGIQSALGRTAGAVAGIGAQDRTDWMARAARGETSTMGAIAAAGVSLFDPVVAELAYRWFSRPGDTILDPFAGGSVRGIVASILARWYIGIDIRREQIEANREQVHLGSDHTPIWLEGDATRLRDTWDDECDMILTCPPYGDLEAYSDDERDISTWTYPEFLAGQQQAITDSVAALRPDRFAVWITSDIRDKRGVYRGLVAETITQFRAAGMDLQNDLIILDQVGHAALRAERAFRGSRAASRVHQHALVFVKGSARRATKRIEGTQ